jgi:SAM-dependent methyltransferase
MLRQIPARADRVLDAGCGSGALAERLAARSAQVDAVDVSEVMIRRARRSGARGNVRWLRGDLLDPGLSLAPGGYDAVTVLSSVHHLPLRAGLARLAGLVRGGGVLVIVGLYRPATAADWVTQMLALPANGFVGAWLALRGRAGKRDEDMPVGPAGTTLSELRSVTAEVLPGFKPRRRLFWRYSLVWRRPPGR